MSNLTSKELDLYSNKILEDYDAKNPSQIFKNKKVNKTIKLNPKLTL